MTARDREQSIDIEMRLEMIGQRIDRGLDLLLVSQRRHLVEILQPGAAEGIAGEEPVDMGALDATIRG